jgi:hypothetical protein
MIGDPDEDCVRYKELHDMMKVMIELFTKNQALPQQIIISFRPFLLLMVLIAINILLGK